METVTLAGGDDNPIFHRHCYLAAFGVGHELVHLARFHVR